MRINYMKQHKKNSEREKHICPFQVIIERKKILLIIVSIGKINLKNPEALK